MIAVILARNSMIRVAIFEIGFHIQLYWQPYKEVGGSEAGSGLWSALAVIEQ